MQEACHNNWYLKSGIYRHGAVILLQKGMQGFTADRKEWRLSVDRRYRGKVDAEKADLLLQVLAVDMQDAGCLGNIAA